MIRRSAFGADGIESIAFMRTLRSTCWKLAEQRNAHQVAVPTLIPPNIGLKSHFFTTND
jgi:hypothetical protein